MTETPFTERIGDNWLRVKQEVADAESTCGRQVGSTRIIGVSKYVDVDMTRALVDAGCTDLAESRPQSLWQKAESGLIPNHVQWHLIGHLQRNKIRRLLFQDVVIHSIDSERVLTKIASESCEHRKSCSVLFEVNISGDEAKTGFAADQIAGVLERLPVNGVTVVGLMAMAGWGTDSSEARKQFQRTRLLRDRLRKQTGHELNELSMGMSGDFREAIAEGSTMVRIGSRLFEGLQS